jgi:hypothetical protein
LSFEIIGSFDVCWRSPLATEFVSALQPWRIGMNNRLVGCLIAGALGAALAFASPALARGGGGMGGHGGGMGGGMRGSGIGGGMHAGAMGGGGMGGGAHFGGMGRAAHFGGGNFAGTHFGHSGFSPRFSRFAFHDGRFFHHRNRFFFAGAPFAYAAYDGCWRRSWTPYGVQWVNVCGDYGYY